MNGIVVGVDGSDNSLDALRWAAVEARLHGCTLHVVGTYTTPIMSTGYELAVPDPSDLEAAARTVLDSAVDTLAAEDALDGVDVEIHAVEGHAGERLISLAADALMLVVGSRGHGGFIGLLLGSVTNYVVSHARCPVTVVRREE